MVNTTAQFTESPSLANKHLRPFLEGWVKHMHEMLETDQQVKRDRRSKRSNPVRSPNQNYLNIRKGKR